MSAAENFDELFGEASERVKRQEIPDEWGPLRQTEEGERLLTRFLGRDTLPPFDDAVFRFIDYPGGPSRSTCGTRRSSSTCSRTRTSATSSGLVRGRDKDIGKPNPMQTWDGWVRPCDEPLVATDVEDDGDGIPF